MNIYSSRKKHIFFEHEEIFLSWASKLISISLIDIPFKSRNFDKYFDIRFQLCQKKCLKVKPSFRKSVFFSFKRFIHSTMYIYNVFMKITLSKSVWNKTGWVTMTFRIYFFLLLELSWKFIENWPYFEYKIDHN